MAGGGRGCVHGTTEHRERVKSTGANKHSTLTRHIHMEAFVHQGTGLFSINSGHEPLLIKEPCGHLALALQSGRKQKA